MTAPATTALAWDQARVAAHDVGTAHRVDAVELPLTEADGATLARPLLARTDLPAFPTSSIDGWATRGPAPWRIVGRILAGTAAGALSEDGTCVEIATGAMVPDGTEQIVRVEDSARTADGRVTGTARPAREWRDRGDEANAGEELFPAGTPVTPGLIGLAASCGLAAMATQVTKVEDTLDAHIAAIRSALESKADLICTTGGTMHGPVDHLHPALRELGGEYVVNTVEVRPGFPMLLARLPGNKLVAGLPGNPQSAFVALLSLAAPALAGLSGRPLGELPTIRLGENIAGRGRYTHLALVDRDGRPVSHVGSSMLRGLAGAVGFAVIPPESAGVEGDEAALVPLPLLEGERP